MDTAKRRRACPGIAEERAFSYTTGLYRTWSESPNMTRPNYPAEFEQARNELFSHILRCGVIEATEEHQKDWFDDTMEYLAERYLDLSDDQLDDLRVLGERYCRPVIKRDQEAGEAASTDTKAENEAVGATG